jgi:hypothetical protein
MEFPAATLNLNFAIKYFSDSQAKWVDTQVTQMVPDGSIELQCKQGQFMHLGAFDGKLKLKNDKPIPDDFLKTLQSHPSARPTPATTGSVGTSIYSTRGKPELKRTRTGIQVEQVAPLQFSLTADSVAAVPPGFLPGGIPGLAQGSIPSFPGADAPQDAHGGDVDTAAFDPWAGAAANRFGAPAHADH